MNKIKKIQIPVFLQALETDSLFLIRKEGKRKVHHLPSKKKQQ